MLQLRRRMLFAGMALLVTGCASRGNPTWETPSVSLTSFGLAPETGGTPRFRIGLRIVNPNSTPLKMRGMSYSVALEDQRMLNSVASNLADVPPWGESEIELRSGIDLLGGLRFFNELLSSPERDKLRYAFNAKIEVEGALLPLRITEEGELSLAQETPRY